MASLIDDNAADGNLGKGNIWLIKLGYTSKDKAKKILDSLTKAKIRASFVSADNKAEERLDKKDVRQ